MRDFLKEAIDFSTEKVVLFKFNSKSELAAYSMGIYCTLIELSDSFLTLVDNQKYTGSLSIYRCFLENYVDLNNLKIDPCYVNQLNYDSYRQDQRILKGAIKNNPYLKSISNNAEDILPLISVEIDNLKKNKDYKICESIKEKFVRSNMEDEYEGIYPTLSAESHCSIDAIIHRHFSINSMTGSMDISINSKDNRKDYKFYMANMTNYLINAGILLANIMEGQQLEIYVRKRKQLLDAM